MVFFVFLCLGFMNLLRSLCFHQVCKISCCSCFQIFLSAPLPLLQGLLFTGIRPLEVTPQLPDVLFVCFHLLFFSLHVLF